MIILMMMIIMISMILSIMMTMIMKIMMMILMMMMMMIRVMFYFLITRPTSIIVLTTLSNKGQQTYDQGNKTDRRHCLR